MWKFWWQLNFSELKCSMIFLLKVRAPVCIWILDGKVFHTTEVRKNNEWEYRVVRAGPRMSCRGFLWMREARDDPNRKRKAERGSGRLFSSWCKRQRLVISLLHRRAGQLSCARRSDFGVCQGARKIRRATAAWMRSIARASSSDMVPCLFAESVELWKDNGLMFLPSCSTLLFGVLPGRGEIWRGSPQWNTKDQLPKPQTATVATAQRPK